MSGYYYCENCEGNAGGHHCAACSRPARWISQTQVNPPSQPAPARRKRPVCVTQERGHREFQKIRDLLARDDQPH